MNGELAATVALRLLRNSCRTTTRATRDLIHLKNLRNKNKSRPTEANEFSSCCLQLLCISGNWCWLYRGTGADHRVVESCQGAQRSQADVHGINVELYRNKVYTIGRNNNVSQSKVILMYCIVSNVSIWWGTVVTRGCSHLTGSVHGRDVAAETATSATTYACII